MPRSSAKSGQKPDSGFAALVESQAGTEKPNRPAGTSASRPAESSRPDDTTAPSPRNDQRDTAAASDPAGQAGEGTAPETAAEAPADVAACTLETAPVANVTEPAPDHEDDAAMAVAVAAPVMPDPAAAVPTVPAAVPAVAAPAPAPEVATPAIEAAAAAPAAVEAPAAIAPKLAESTDQPVPADAAPAQLPEKAAVKTAPKATPQAAAKAEDAPAENAEAMETGAAPETQEAAPKPVKPTAAPHQNHTHGAGPHKPDAQPALTVESDKADDAMPMQKPSAEIAHTLATPVPAHAAAHTATTPQAAPVSAAQPIPVNALAIEIAGQARAGNSRFEIRLDPPELGRIDVRLDVDRDGNVTSRLVIERADTYDLLRRDQSTLERALQQAGLKTSDNALEFSLRDQGFAQQQRDESLPRGTAALVAESDVLPAEAASGYGRLLGGRGGIDIRV